MPVQDMQRRLAEANVRHKRALRGPDGPEANTYQMQLRKAEFRESRKGLWTVYWRFVILDGEFQGEEVGDVSSIESEHSFPLRQCIKRVTKLGFSPPANNWGYQELCPQMTAAAPIVLAELSYSDDYQRINIVQLLVQSATPAVAEAAPPAPTPAVVPPPAIPIVQAAPAVPMVQTTMVADVGDTVQCSEEDNTVTVGIVDSISGTTATVGIDAENAFEAELSELTVIQKAAVAAPAQVPALAAPAASLPVIVPPIPAAPPPVGDPQFNALIELAGNYGIRVSDLNTKDEVVEALKNCEWRADLITEAADVALLQSLGIQIDPAPAPAPAAPPPPPPPAPTTPRRTAKKKKKKVKKRKKRA